MVNRQFYKHPKAIRARSLEPGSISLWLFAHCWCRSHRGQNTIPRSIALELGSEAEIKALVDSGLWTEAADSYEFHDWQDWNADMLRATPKSSAMWITLQALPNHPYDVQSRVAVEVQKLIDEGISRTVIEAALKKWESRPDARVTWLAYFASDAIREGEAGIHAAIKEARISLNMRPLADYGHRWQAPDVPDDANTAKAIRDFMRDKKHEWLDEIEAGLRSESTSP